MDNYFAEDIESYFNSDGFDAVQAALSKPKFGGFTNSTSTDKTLEVLLNNIGTQCITRNSSVILYLRKAHWSAFGLLALHHLLFAISLCSRGKCKTKTGKQTQSVMDYLQRVLPSMAFTAFIVTLLGGGAHSKLLA